LGTISIQEGIAIKETLAVRLYNEEYVNKFKSIGVVEPYIPFNIHICGDENIVVKSPEKPLQLSYRIDGPNGEDRELYGSLYSHFKVAELLYSDFWACSNLTYRLTFNKVGTPLNS